jgi:RNA polymerase sigma-70 factor (ECF subfamily)
MAPGRRTGDGDARARTLGDLLYADATRTPASEDGWIRLVRAIGNGDQDALHTLYEQAHRLVFTLMVRITNDLATAEELTVDVFHDVWRRAATYDPAGGSVVGWIMNQARSRAIDRVRFEGRKKRVKRDVDAPPAGATAPDPEAIVDVRDRARVVWAAMDALTPAEREAIETAFFGDRTYREVASKLNKPLGTIKTRVRSGLAKLRRALAATVTGR